MKPPSPDSTKVISAETEALRAQVQGEVASIRAGRELQELSVEELRLIKAKLLELKRKLKPESESGSLSLDQAREIMDKDMLGPEAIQKAFGFEVDESEIPPIPYTPEKLEQAKELGEMLILRVGHDKEGKPMTMQHINEIAKLDPKKDGKLLFDANNWYRDEDFFNNQPLKTEWKLVGKEFIPDSTSKNYIQQTRLLRDYLKAAGSLTKEEEKGCSDKILKDMSDDLGIDWATGNILDGKKYDMNWKIVSRKLSELAINMNHRRSPAEILYDQVLRFKSGQSRGKLETNYDWSNTISSDGSLVGVGEFGADGAYVGRWVPGDRRGGLGVVPLR